MSDLSIIKYATKGLDLHLRVATGHFAAGNRHSNYFIDVSWPRARLSEARAIAENICAHYYTDTVVDTILCLDGTEVIGACLANALSKGDYINMNAHKTIYVITPEILNSNQMVLRDNIKPMVAGKHVMILSAIISSGKLTETAIQMVQYYGGTVTGVCAYFSAIKDCEGIPIKTVFTPEDLTGYQNFPAHECPICKEKRKLDALVNHFGYSKL